MRAATAGGPRPWLLVEARAAAADGGDGAAVLAPPKWRGDARAMAVLERECDRGCGVQQCTKCRGRVFGGVDAPRLAHEGEQDPIGELVSAAKLWKDPESAPPSKKASKSHDIDGQAHLCRRWRATVLATLRQAWESSRAHAGPAENLGRHVSA